MTTLALETSAQAMPLRPYQAQALDAIAAAERDGVRRQLVVIPTGLMTVHFAARDIRKIGRARR